MHVTMFLCDGVAFADGKLYPHGVGWNSFASPTVPAMVPTLGIGIVVGLTAAEAGVQHEFDLVALDPSGAPFSPPQPGTDTGTHAAVPLRVAGRLEASSPGPGAAEIEQVALLALNFRSLTFPDPGAYRFQLTIDDRLCAELPLYVRRTDAAGQA